MYRAIRILRRALSDLVGESAVHSSGDTLVLSVVDQAALVTLIARLTDLGIRIEQVTRARAD